METFSTAFEPAEFFIRAIRESVFCQEQGVAPAEEWDGKDAKCLHALALVDAKAVGTGRLSGTWRSGQSFLHLAGGEVHKNTGRPFKETGDQPLAWLERDARDKLLPVVENPGETPLRESFTIRPCGNNHDSNRRIETAVPPQNTHRFEVPRVPLSVFGLSPNAEYALIEIRVNLTNAGKSCLAGSTRLSGRPERKCAIADFHKIKFGRADTI